MQTLDFDIPSSSAATSKADSARRPLSAFSSGRLLLCLSIAGSSLADWTLILLLSSTVVMTAPSSDVSGAVLLFLPLYVFMVLTGAFSDFIKIRVRAHFGLPFKIGALLNIVDTAKLTRLALALVLSVPQWRAALLSGPEAVIASICLLLLASHWSMLKLMRSLAPRMLTTSLVSILTASWALGQAVALKLSPYFTADFRGAWPGLFAAVFYLCATLCASRVRRSLSPTLQTEPELAPDYYPHGLMVGLMSLPALGLIVSTALFAIEGLDLAGTSGVILSLGNLASKLTVAFALGALAAPFIEHRARQRLLWLFGSLLTVALYGVGALARDSMVASFTLYTAAALTGALATIEEARFLRHLRPDRVGLTLSLRNAHVLLFSGLLALPIERTIAVVTPLYLLKQLNLHAVLVSLAVLALAPVVIVLGARYKKSRDVVSRL